MNLARLDLPSLRLVVLCAESGSVSAAAPRAALSITGASFKLRSLEDLLGVRVFERVPNGLRSTEAGAAIIDKCKKIIDLVDEFVELAKAASSDGGSATCPSCGGTVSYKHGSRGSGSTVHQDLVRGIPARQGARI